jgi:pimeloyl-ACP methyl ester carboxylesterase
MRKKIISYGSRAFPKTMAYYAYKILTNPQQKKIRPNESEILDKAVKQQVRFGRFNIQLYKWGIASNELILLVHGWEGHSGNFADIIKRLVLEGYCVLAFDGPSHGYSTKGQTNLLEFSDLIIQIIESHRPKKIISHSFGAVVTTYALSRGQHLEIDKYVMITTPDSFLERIKYISSQVGIEENAQHALIRKLERELKTNIKSIAVSEFAKNMSVKNALILHGRNDKIIPLKQARIVNENCLCSELEIIENTGHYKILTEVAVMDRIVKFLNNSKDDQ